MERILVIRSGAVGDLILTLPVLAALRRRYPDARIDVMGAPATVALAVCGGYAGRGLSIDQREMAPFFSKDGLWPSAMSGRLARYGLAVSFLPDADGVFRANLLRAGVGRVISGSPKPASGMRRHASHHYLEALAPLGVAPPAAPPELHPDATAVAHGMAWIGKTRPGPLVALHPGSGGRHKCWPPDRYGRLCDRLTAMGYTPVLTAGPADEGVIQAVMAGASAARPVVVDQAPLTHLAGLLTRCRAMMGNDSGITHLAAAVGIPTIALFGPTDPAVWGPRGKTVRIVWGEEVVEEDAGMRAWPAPFAARALTAVSVEAVLSVFTAL